jgi:hypothetical protein
MLPGETALELPGAAGHPGYPLALAVTAMFASNRGDVTGAEELCRRAADANARRDTPDWRVEETICVARSNIAITTGAPADAARPNIRLPHLLARERSAGRPWGTTRPAERDLIRAFPPHPEWLIPVLSAPQYSSKLTSPTAENRSRKRP